MIRRLTVPVLLECEPDKPERTLSGLLAMIVYASEADDECPEAFNLCQQSLAAAAAQLGGRVS